MIKVLVIIDDSSEFSRRLLRGLIKYSNDNESWIFFQLPSYYKSLNGTNGIRLGQGMEGGCGNSQMGS